MRKTRKLCLAVLLALLLLALAWFSWLSRPKQPFRDLRPEEIERVYAYYGGFLPEELEAGETAALLDILRETTLYEPRIILFGYGGTFTYTQEPMFRLFLSDGTQLEVERIEDIRANGLDPRVAALLQ